MSRKGRTADGGAPVTLESSLFRRSVRWRTRPEFSSSPVGNGPGGSDSLFELKTLRTENILPQPQCPPEVVEEPCFRFGESQKHRPSKWAAWGGAIDETMR